MSPRNPDCEFAQSLTALEAASALLSGRGSPNMLAALETSAESSNPRISASSRILLALYNGTEPFTTTATDDLARCDVATMGGVLDFEAAQTRKALAREASKNWSPDGRGGEPA